MARLKPMKTQYDNEVSQAVYSTWRTQREAADALGITQASLAVWIRLGQVPFDKLADFIVKTGVKPETISTIYRKISRVSA